MSAAAKQNEAEAGRDYSYCGEKDGDISKSRQGKQTLWKWVGFKCVQSVNIETPIWG